MKPIRFGTDGWRAVIAEDFTFENVARVARAAASFWRARRVNGKPGLLVAGYDRRFLSAEFARAAADEFAAAGFDVLLSDQSIPTPAVSFTVARRGALGGVVITASHNPGRYNGFKLKDEAGAPAAPAMSEAIEGLLDRDPEPGPSGRVMVRDLRPAYYRAILGMVDFKAIAKSGLRFAHDAMYGAGAGCFDDLLRGTTCQVTTLNGEADPNFGGCNPEPIPANYRRSGQYLRRHPHDLCLVTDGDADRIGAMDGRGNPLTTHQVISILLYHLQCRRGQRGRVIKALNTTSMVDRMCAEFGLELVETPVGFKHIAARMREGNYLLGAEESGGIGFPGHIPERDGILGGLLLLECLAMERVSLPRILARLERRFGPHAYDRIDAVFPVEKRPLLMEHCRTNPPARLDGSHVVDMKTYDGVKYIAADGSWLMLRGSGTEPVLRIYAESTSPDRAKRLLKTGVALIERV